MKKTFIYEKKCSICRGKDYERLFEKKDLFVEICRDCGLIRLNPHWDKRTYNAFYKVDYDFSRVSINSESKDSEFRKERIIEFFMSLKKAKIKEFSPKTILDIGAGDGIDLECLRSFLLKKDSDFYTIEPSEACIKELKERGFKVIAKDGESNWNKKYKNFFDFISIRNVLEHMLDPLSVLKKISNSLKEDGLVFMSVPNMSNPDLSLTTFFEIPHTHYFSKNSIKNAMIKSGLEPILILDKNKVFPKTIYILARKKRKGFKKNHNFSKKEYFEKRKFILNQISKESNNFFPIFVVFYKLKNKFLVLIKKLKISKFKKRFFIEGLKKF